MSRRAPVAVLLAAGAASLAGACSTVPERPKPTGDDVARIKHEVRVVVAEALLNSPWSKVQADAIAAQGTSLEHRIDQVAEAAGIDTTVPVPAVRLVGR